METTIPFRLKFNYACCSGVYSHRRRNRQGEEVNISGSCHERADGITAACSYSRYLPRAAVGLGAQILVYYGSETELQMNSVQPLKYVALLALTSIFAAGELSCLVGCCQINSCLCVFFRFSLFLLLHCPFSQLEFGGIPLPVMATGVSDLHFVFIQILKRKDLCL